MPRCCA
ncbi:hypothetical protein D046_4953A, partial [Vibrio parahaemolyticus V-223/04]